MTPDETEVERVDKSFVELAYVLGRQTGELMLQIHIGDDECNHDMDRIRELVSGIAILQDALIARHAENS